MKIKLWSDLHLERRLYKYDHIWWPAPQDRDTTLVLAGDIGEGFSAEPFVSDLCQHFKNVLYVFGNHEFWGQDYFALIKKWQDFELSGPKNFHFLYNDWRIIDGVRFLGGTMWTSLNEADVLTIGAATRVMNDYREISVNGKNLTADFVIAEHDKFMTFLLEKFDEPFEGKTVVISHHSPGNKLRVTGRPVVDLSDHCYYADIEDVIGYHNVADLWLHGHTHDSRDYLINETRVLCNPYGYWGVCTNKKFDSEFIVEI